MEFMFLHINFNYVHSLFPLSGSFSIYAVFCAANVLVLKVYFFKQNPIKFKELKSAFKSIYIAIYIFVQLLWMRVLLVQLKGNFSMAFAQLSFKTVQSNASPAARINAA